MLDLAYCGIVVVLLLLSIALVRGLDKLMGGRHE